MSQVLRETAGGSLVFKCPGCEHFHTVQYGDGPGPRWGWNGDRSKPTFNPSVLVQGVKRLTEAELQGYEMGWGLPEPVKETCHSFIRDGQIEFLQDSTHELAGKTVSLPELV